MTQNASHFRLRFSLLLAGTLAFTWNLAMAQSKYDDKSVAELDKMLSGVVARGKQLRVLNRLQGIGEKIVKGGRCQPDFVRARQTRDKLLQLNKRYQGRADNNYRNQANTLRRDNQTALSRYRRCFSEEIRTKHLWKEQNVVDYNTFDKRFRQLAVELQGETEADLNRKANEIYAAKQRKLAVSKFPFAELASVKGEVRLTRDGRAVRLSRGINILAGDEIRIGGNGSMVVAFTEVIGRVKRGPYDLSVGPNTKVTISRDTNMVVQQPGQTKIHLGLDLAYGSVRVINSGTGSDTTYRVRAGIERANLLGGDSIVSYYPKRALLNLKLRTGRATVGQANQNAIRLKPNTQVSVRRGVAQRVYNLRDEQWTAAVRASGNHVARQQPVAQPPQSRQPVARQDVLLRAASREAVNRMLGALRDGNANEWLRSVRGQALANAQNTLRGNSLERVLARSGRPTSWQTDCVACERDGTCQVPTVVNLTGSRRYEALHVVRPSADRRVYQVDSIAQWTGDARNRFNANRPLCAAELK